MTKLIKLLIIAIILTTNTFAGTIDPDVKDKQYLDHAKNFPYVILLVGITKKDIKYSGSAVAYKDNVILTAAHLFEDSKTSSVLVGNKLIPIKKIVSHQKYKHDIFGKYDIAICLLSDTMKLEKYPELYEKDDELGKFCELSGYGATGNFLHGVISPGGLQRAGSNTIDGTNDFLLFCSPSVKHNKTLLEFIIAAGDSGGGLFIDNKLAGIHSAVIEDKPNRHKSKYGTVSTHTRISKYRDWINSEIIKLERINK
jgi:secreted trypsin-like serine protease